MSERLTHFDENGKTIMADVSEKEITATLCGGFRRDWVSADVMAAIQMNFSAKRATFWVFARIAGIMA